MYQIAGLAAVLFLAACSNNNGFVVEGEIKGGDVSKVYLLRVNGQEELIDSFAVGENGKFKFVGTEPKRGVYRLNFGNVRAVDLVLDNASKVELKLDTKAAMSEYDVTGSEASLKVKDINNILYATYKKVEALQNTFAEKQSDPNIEAIRADLEKQYQVAIETQVVDIKAFIDQNTDPLLDMYAVSYLNIDENYDFISKLMNEHQAKVGESEYTQEFYNKFKMYANVSVGAVAPDINLQTPDGKTVALSSLRGKVVMIDFWASWCGPCRRENPNVVKLYNKYKDKGFEIYGVSLDRNKEDWVKAIADDKLTWTHVSDLKFWESEAAALYKVEAIPATFLLDKDGKIIAKNLRGEQLEAFLNKLFI